MMYLSIAMMFLGTLAFSAFCKFLKFKTPAVSTNPVEDLKADVNRIKLAMGIKTFIGGEKK